MYQSERGREAGLPLLPLPSRHYPSTSSLTLPFPPTMLQKEAVELLAGCFAPQRSAPLGACVTSNQPSRELEPRDEPCAKEHEVEGSNIHPVLQLGWAPLCTVVCNGLYGEFLGGHDKDLYIRCISSGYEDLPDTDIGTVREQSDGWDL